jgi:hypothetical protein
MYGGQLESKVKRMGAAELRGAYSICIREKTNFHIFKFFKKVYLTRVVLRKRREFTVQTHILANPG